MAITAAAIMSTNPCVRWPLAAVEAALARADCSSWSTLVDSASADLWRTCSRDDMRWVLCQYAAQHRREDVLTPWVVEVTHRRVTAQRARWPSASPATVAIWDRLERWRGDREEIFQISVTASQVTDATERAAAAAYVAAAAAAAAAAYAAADDVVTAATTIYVFAVNDAAADTAATAADYASEMILDLARRLDEVERNGRPRASVTRA